MSKPQTEKQQLKQLYNQILGKPSLTGNDVFHVFPIEASVGKTYTMKSALADLYNTDPKVKSLVITLFTNEADSIASDINVQVGKDIAIAYHSKNKTKAVDCIDYPIVIITHAKYKKLCVNSVQRFWERSILTRGRLNLIIDEEVDLLVTWSIKLDDFYFIEEVLNERSQNYSKQYQRLLYPIAKTIGIFSVGYVYRRFWGKDAYSQSTSRAISFIKHLKLLRFTGDFFTNFEQKYGYTKAKKKYDSILDSMLSIFDNPMAILDKTGLYTGNRNINTIMFDNNILLDASASISTLYNSNYFYVRPLRRIVDHSNWKLCLYETNSSADHKKKHFEFYDEISDFIVDKCDTNDKALILCKKCEEKKYDKAFLKKKLSIKEYDTVNFWAMRGKNDWLDYNKCFVVHFPYEPLRNYVFRYMLWFPGKQLTNRHIITGTRKGGLYGFINQDEINDLMESAVISSIYQGIKRINRKNKLEATVYVVTNRIDMFKRLSTEFINVARKRVIKPMTTRTYKQRKSKYTDAFIQLLKDKIADNTTRNMTNVVVRKDEFSNKLGCSKIGDILKNQKVVDFMNKHSIRNEKKTLVFD